MRGLSEIQLLGIYDWIIDQESKKVLCFGAWPIWY